MIYVSNVNREKTTVYQKASFLLTYRQINPKATKWGRIIRDADFEEIDIGFKNGWADFEAIEDFSLGGEVRLVGNTGQGIGYDFVQTTYLNQAVMILANGDWVEDEWGNKAFEFGGRLGSQIVDTGQWRGTRYFVDDTDVFNVALSDYIAFSTLVSDVLHSENTPSTKVYFSKSQVSGSLINRFFIRNQRGAPTLVDFYLADKNAAAATFANRYSDETLFMYYNNLNLKAIYNDQTTYLTDEITNSDNMLQPFCLGGYSYNSTTNTHADTYIECLVTEFIGWDGIDLESKNNEIRSELNTLYNVI